MARSSDKSPLLAAPNSSSAYSTRFITALRAPINCCLSVRGGGAGACDDTGGGVAVSFSADGDTGGHGIRFPSSVAASSGTVPAVVVGVVAPVVVVVGRDANSAAAPPVRGREEFRRLWLRLGWSASTIGSSWAIP